MGGGGGVEIIVFKKIYVVAKINDSRLFFTTSSIETNGKLQIKLLTLHHLPSPQNGQTHSNNSPFWGVERVKGSIMLLKSFSIL